MGAIAKMLRENVRCLQLPINRSILSLVLPFFLHRLSRLSPTYLKNQVACSKMVSSFILYDLKCSQNHLFPSNNTFISSGKGLLKDIGSFVYGCLNAK